MRKPTVAVFGTGPAGLLAVHTAKRSGAEVILVGEGIKSTLYGAQFLHSLPPDLAVLSGGINYTLRGTAEEYRQKVYGSENKAAQRMSVSPEIFSGVVAGYDIREAYDQLWNWYGWESIRIKILNGYDFQNTVAEVGADVVVSTIPAPFMCLREEHAFTSEKIWAIGDAPDLEIKCPVRVEPNTVVCNGEPEPAWYRASNIFGYCTVEWPHSSKPPIPLVASVTKPLDTTCQCFPDVIRGGRYGQWKKGVLSDSIIARVGEAVALSVGSR